MKLYEKSQVKEALIEIIDALISMETGEKENAKIQMLLAIERFRNHYFSDYRLKGSTMRVRVKGMMLVGMICSYRTSFPKSEKLWRILHEYAVDHYDPKTGITREYIMDHPDEETMLKDMEMESEEEIRKFILNHPIGETHNYSRIIESFETMRHLAHIGQVTEMINPKSTNWMEVNPWTLERSGKSLLVDYWWNVPDQYKEFANTVMNKISSKDIKNVGDLVMLKRMVELW